MISLSEVLISQIYAAISLSLINEASSGFLHGACKNFLRCQIFQVLQNAFMSWRMRQGPTSDCPPSRVSNAKITLFAYHRVRLRECKITYRCGLLNQILLSLDLIIQLIVNYIK